MQVLQPPALLPLEGSHDADEVELQLKSLTAEVFREYCRAYERELNVYGIPHLGSFDLVEQWVKADGLAMVRGNSQEAMRYLFKAWRARNPKRGLHFLTMYLNLLWPGAASADQLWQQKALAYPDGLVKRSEIMGEPREGHFLTSRVAVEVDSEDESGAGLQSVRRALRSVLGAKFILLLRLVRSLKTDLGALSFFQAAIQTQHTGELMFPREITPEQIDVNIIALGETSLIVSATATL